MYYASARRSHAHIVSTSAVSIYGSSVRPFSPGDVHVLCYGLVAWGEILPVAKKAWGGCSVPTISTHHGTRPTQQGRFFRVGLGLCGSWVRISLREFGWSVCRMRGTRNGATASGPRSKPARLSLAGELAGSSMSGVLCLQQEQTSCDTAYLSAFACSPRT